MPTDATSKEPDAPRPLWELPDVLVVKIKRIPYQAPKLRYFESYLAKYTEAIEFVVKTNRPFPIRALMPVLYVGDTLVGECARVKENVYRFLAFKFDKLKEGAPISLGWFGQPKEEWRPTKFRYKSPEYDQTR